MPIDRRSPTAPAWLVAALLFAGCGRGPAGLGLTGDDARSRLPEELRPLVPPGLVLRLDEESNAGAYRLWVLQDPATTAPLAIPPAGRKGIEAHAVPIGSIESILRARLPGLDLGTPRDRRGRFTHWDAADGSELRLREAVTDRGWFATVERVRP